MKTVTTPAPEGLRHRDGLTWSLRSNSDDGIGPGPHENGLYELLAKFLSPDSVFVDAGAHVGHYSLRMARHCSKVIAIEPNPAAREALYTNISLNKLTNITVHDVAAHHKDETLRLWDPFNVTGGSCTRTLSLTEVSPRPKGYGISTLFFGPGGFGKYLGVIRALSIDSLIHSVSNRVALLKIDVEGNEGNVLAGATRTILQHQPTVLIEMHHRMYDKSIWANVMKQLSELDYTWEVFTLPPKSPAVTSQDNDFLYAEPAGRKLYRPRLRSIARMTMVISSR